MNINLTHTDLCHLVCGITFPDKSRWAGLHDLGIGTESNDEWWWWNPYSYETVTRQWDAAWRALTEQQLWDLYQSLLPQR